MKTTAEHVKDFLVEDGIGSNNSSDDWFISIAGSPDQDKTITIRDTVSGDPFYGINDKSSENALFEPSFQIIIRSLDFAEGRDKVQEIRDFFLDNLTKTADSSIVVARYASFVSKGGPFFGGFDESERYVWDMNYRTFRKEK